jgi:WD repeat-containing protein 23
MIKLWDKRSLNNGNKPSGAFFGHLEDITHICSKGDDKFIASNGKD